MRGRRGHTGQGVARGGLGVVSDSDQHSHLPKVPEKEIGVRATSWNSSVPSWGYVTSDDEQNRMVGEIESSGTARSRQHTDGSTRLRYRRTISEPNFLSFLIFSESDIGIDNHQVTFLSIVVQIFMKRMIVISNAVRVVAGKFRCYLRMNWKFAVYFA